MRQITDLNALFWPRAIAVLGASRDPSAIGNKLVSSLRDSGFPGPIYPINPAAEEIGGLKAYASLAMARHPVDLAIFAVPAEKITPLVDDCYAAGVKAIVVISAGFSETGEPGKAMQRELLDKVRRYGMRMVGPNCFGIVNVAPERPMNATFSKSFPLPGRVAMASQSGAMGLAILNLSREYQLGLSQFVSMGNKADVSSNDLIEYWEKEEGTEAILLYLESFGNPARFGQIARRVGRKKPILALKSGRTAAGTRAASSHTAALASNDAAVEALFKQTGVLRVETLEEMFHAAGALVYQPLPRGKRLGIITNAGGPAILAADACEAVKLEVARFSESTCEILRRFLPAVASVVNPVDLVASAGPDRFGPAIEAVFTAEETDALLVIYAVIDAEASPAILDSIRQGISRARASGVTKPVLFVLMKDENARLPLVVGEEKIPVYRFPEEAVRALGHLYRYARWREQPESEFRRFSTVTEDEVRSIPSSGPEGRRWLSADETREVLSAFHFPLLKGGVAQSAEEATQIAERTGFPVALKLASRTFVHKTEVGGVRLNLKSPQEVAEAFTDMKRGLEQLGRVDAFDGALIQPMAKSGIEVFLGMQRDPLFGPLIAFGLGGIFVEILSDVTMRLAPLTERDAKEMIREIRGFKRLEGYRGAAGADLEALADLILRLAYLAERLPKISSLDFNPVMAFPPGQGCVVVDARIELGP